LEIPLEAGRTRRRLLVGQEEEEKGSWETPLIFVTAVTPAVEIQPSPRSLMWVEEEKGRKGRRKEVRRSLLEEGEGEGEEKEAAGGGSSGVLTAGSS
jgi:hypothetical protein